MNKNNDSNDSGRSVVAALFAAMWMVLGIAQLSAQEPGSPGGGGNDIEMIVDMKDLGTQVDTAVRTVGSVLGGSKIPTLSNELRNLAKAGSKASAKSVDGVLAGMVGEYDKLGPGLKIASDQLENVADSVETARAQLEGWLAKRQVAADGNGAGGTRNKALEGYRNQLRDLGLRSQSTKSAFERQNLERVFDSSWQLYQVVQRVHGKLSETERVAITRVLQFLTRLQTNVTVAATRVKVLSVSVGHERELLGHFRSVLGLISGTQDVIAQLGKLIDGTNPFMGDIDKILANDVGGLLERFIDEMGKGLDEASEKLLQGSVMKNEPTILDASGRERAFAELGIPKPDSIAKQGGK